MFEDFILPSKGEALNQDEAPAEFLEELKDDARSVGIEPELVSVGSADDHDNIPVIVGKRAGGRLKRMVPKECLGESGYRTSLLRNMLIMLA